MKSNNLIVLIPHFCNPSGLLDSIKSIDEDINIDILIVDDGSEKLFDEKQIEIAFKNTGKIHYKYLPQNQGIEYALNTGLKFIQNLDYKYIARLDCGDKCKQNRFKKQLNHLESNPEIKLLGTWANVVDENGKHIHYIKHPTKYTDIKRKMYVNSMFVHPTVMFSIDVLDKVGYYPTNVKAAEDYAFFFKIIKHFKAENLPEVLLDYEYNENSISTSKRKLQVKNRLKIITKHFYIGLMPIYGLLRNTILLFISRRGTTYLKTIWKNH